MKGAFVKLDLMLDQMRTIDKPDDRAVQIKTVALNDRETNGHHNCGSRCTCNSNCSCYTDCSDFDCRCMYNY